MLVHCVGKDLDLSRRKAEPILVVSRARRGIGRHPHGRALDQLAIDGARDTG